MLYVELTASETRNSANFEIRFGYYFIYKAALLIFYGIPIKRRLDLCLKYRLRGLGTSF